MIRSDLSDTTPDQESVGQRLRRLRLERGLSQRELSSPGVSYAYISRIEAGARRPSVKALRMLARKLGVSADYLETGAELGARDTRELRLSDAELQIRLDEQSDTAAAELREILAEALAEGDAAAATRARIALGLAAHQAGRDGEAITLLEEALATDAVSPVTRPDAFASLGRSYATIGKPNRAVELFDECLDRLRDEAPNDTAAEVRFAGYLANALTDAGNFSRAQEVLQDAVARAEDDADPYTRIRLYWGLGRLAMNQGRPRAALQYFRRAVGLLEATEDTLHLARAYLSCAWVMIEGGHPEAAGPQLERAKRLLGTQAEPVDLVMLRTYEARRLGAIGQAEEAIRLAHEALELAGDTLPEDRGTALLTIAEAYATQEDGRAEDAFRAAAEHIDRLGPPRYRGVVYRGWARVLRKQGRDSEALDLLERATETDKVAR
jgi:tetratricopeptide (TPR) repeat protein